MGPHDVRIAPAGRFAWEGDHLGFAAPGGRALFTTRRGGVSPAPYESLDLDAFSGRPEVAENERIAAVQIGIAPGAWARSVQVHGSTVGLDAEVDEADGHATTRPGVACCVRGADCLPVALLAPEAVAAVHAGWRGLAAGVLEEGVAVLRAAGASDVVAAIGPGAGPCCYEVGPEVHAAFGRHVDAPATIDLKEIAQQRLLAAGVAEVADAGLCTICDERFFSHRRDRGVTGRQAGVRVADLIRGLDPEVIRANVQRIRSEVGEEVELLAAVKYVADEEMGVLAEAGVTLVGENRQQQLDARATAHPELTFDFIGHLQSRKVKLVLPHVRLVHSVSTESVLRQLETHAPEGTEVLVEVNVAREDGKDGVRPEDLDAFLEDVPGNVTVGGLMTMPPFAGDAEDSRRWFAALAELAADRGLPRLSMGTSQDYAVAAQEGATIVRIGTTLYRRS